MTLFKALYGRDPPVLLKWSNRPSRVQELDQQLRERNLILDELKAQLERGQVRMNNQADKHRREVHFEVGDFVYLKLEPYRFQSLAKRPNEKLALRYYGPFLIEEKIGLVAYHLTLPPSA